MSRTEYRCQMYPTADSPGWRLFVVLPGRVSEWPERKWKGRAVPTVAARAAALRQLGYTTVSDAHPWEWIECQEEGVDPVILTAVAHVVQRNA